MTAKSKVVHPISRRLSELGWTQKHLAELTGLSETTISNYVNRKVMLSKYNLKTKRIIKVLGVDINFIRTFY